MQGKILFAVAGLVLALGACDPNVDDRIVYGIGEAPVPRSDFAYENTEKADVQLYSSLRNLGDVRVSFTGATNLPDRLGPWQRELSKAGNSVTVCDTVEAAGGLPFAIPAVAEWVGGMVYDAAKAKVIYNPTKDFNAIVEYNSSQNKLTGLRFVSKSTPLDIVQSGYGSCRA